MAKKDTDLSPYSITKAFNQYLKGIKNRGVLYNFGEHNKEKSFEDFLAEVKENGEKLGLLAYIPSLEEVANRPNAYHDYIVAMIDSLKQYAKSSKGTQLSQRRFVANTIYPIITDAVSKNVGLGCSKEDTNKILDIIFPEDKYAKRKDTRQNIRIKKTHPKLTFVMKKFVAPALVTAGVVAAALGIFAALPIASAIVPQFITDSALVNIATFATIGAVGGLVLTPAAILIKNAVTKHYYNKHYGKKSNNLNTIYNLKENLSEIKNAEKLEEKINGMNLPIMDLWKKIRQTEDKIRETEKKHPHGHKLLNYFRLKANRNRIHTLGQTIDFFNDQQSTQANGNLEIITNLLKKNFNSLIASPKRYGDLVARYNLPRYEEGKHKGEHIGFNDPKVFVPKFRELMRESYKNALIGGKVVEDKKPEIIVDKKETKNEKSTKTPVVLALPLSPEGERRIKLIREAQQRQNAEIEAIRKSRNAQAQANIQNIVVTPPPVNNLEQKTNGTSTKAPASTQQPAVIDNPQPQQKETQVENPEKGQVKEDKTVDVTNIKIEENKKITDIQSEIKMIRTEMANSKTALGNNISSDERIEGIKSIYSKVTELNKTLKYVNERIAHLKDNSSFENLVSDYKACRKTIVSTCKEYNKYLENQRAIVVNKKNKKEQITTTPSQVNDGTPSVNHNESDTQTSGENLISSTASRYDQSTVISYQYNNTQSPSEYTASTAEQHDTANNPKGSPETQGNNAQSVNNTKNGPTEDNKRPESTDSTGQSVTNPAPTQDKSSNKTEAEKTEEQNKSKADEFIAKAEVLLEQIDKYLDWVKSNYEKYTKAKKETTKYSHSQTMKNNLDKLKSKNEFIPKTISTIVNMLKNEKYTEYKEKLSSLKKNLEVKWDSTRQQIEDYTSKLDSTSPMTSNNDRKTVTLQVPEGTTVRVEEV